MITSFVNSFDTQVKFSAIVDDFLCNIPSCFPNSSSKFINKFGMWFFDNKIWHASNDKVCQFMSIYPVGITNFIARFWRTLVIGSFKVFYKPIHEFFVGINDRQAQSVVIMLSPCFGIRPLEVNANASFTINNASQIIQLFDCPHSDPLLGCNYSTGILYHKRENNALNDLSGQMFSRENKAKVLSESIRFRDELEEVYPPNRNYLVKKVKEMLYVAINQQVTLQNQDPLKLIFEN